MNNTSRAKEIFQYADRHGIEKTRSTFDLSYETVTRNIRRYKQFVRESEEPSKLPRILLFDIETLPMWIRVWGLYKQRPNIKQIVKDWIVLSWSAKWLDGTEMMSDILTPKEIKDRDDSRICKSIWKLIDEASIIIAHNCNRFD